MRDTLYKIFENLPHLSVEFFGRHSLKFLQATLSTVSCREEYHRFTKYIRVPTGFTKYNRVTEFTYSWVNYVQLSTEFTAVSTTKYTQGSLSRTEYRYQYRVHEEHLTWVQGSLSRTACRVHKVHMSTRSWEDPGPSWILLPSLYIIFFVWNRKNGITRYGQNSIASRVAEPTPFCGFGSRSPHFKDYGSGYTVYCKKKNIRI